MARKLNLQNLRTFATATHEGASAYDYSASHPLIHLTFTMGSALLTDGFYQKQEQEVRALAKALIAAYKTEPRFAWQYGAWMRDPKNGKGNRIQGSVVPALLDALCDDSEYTAQYVAQCLSHRVDDLMAFVEHYKNLGLGQPSAAARRGIAVALTRFDEYQLMKYKGTKRDVRLCDVIYLVKPELEALGDDATLALAAGRYLHAPTRKRSERMESLPLTRARRTLFVQDKSYALTPEFVEHVSTARVTWEQVLGYFGSKAPEKGGKRLQNEAKNRQRAVWQAMLQIPGLLPDMAFFRNARGLHKAGFSIQELRANALERKFKGVWPHQIYAGFKAERKLEPVFEAAMQRSVALLPKGRHLGIGDASGSMSVRVGGLKGSLTSMDVAFCLVGLMSETSGIGASFSDSSWGSSAQYLSIAKRGPNEGPLAFSMNPAIRRGMGGTQVFGAVMALIKWLKSNDSVAPPDCLWFFSDMQFHPASGARKEIPKDLMAMAKNLGIDTNVPPLELALKLYRKAIGPVDVVLWNLAAYAPIPVPSDMEGVLLVSGFDNNTFRYVETWRQTGQVPGASKGAGKVEDNQEVILDHIRSY